MIFHSIELLFFHMSGSQTELAISFNVHLPGGGQDPNLIFKGVCLLASLIFQIFTVARGKNSGF